MSLLKVGILGAGTMGKQLALLFAANAVLVRVWNYRRQENFQSDFSRLAAIQSKLGYIAKDRVDDVLGRVNYTTDLLALSGCELIVEAVTEDKEIKVSTFKKLTDVVSDCKVIATNTSTLSISELASATGRPSQFIGLHFFNPPMSIKLVEVVKGELTSDATLAATLQIVERIGKQPVVIPEMPGFIVNRLLFPMINEAVFLLSTGAVDAKMIDRCMRLGVHHPMGPLELADLIGLDTCLSILETLAEKTKDNKYRPAPLLKQYVNTRRLGKKMGIGFYSYKNK